MIAPPWCPIKVWAHRSCRSRGTGTDGRRLCRFSYGVIKLARGEPLMVHLVHRILQVAKSRYKNPTFRRGGVPNFYFTLQSCLNFVKISFSPFTSRLLANCDTSMMTYGFGPFCLTTICRFTQSVLRVHAASGNGTGKTLPSSGNSGRSPVPRKMSPFRLHRAPIN